MRRIGKDFVPDGIILFYRFVVSGIFITKTDILFFQKINCFFLGHAIVFNQIVNCLLNPRFCISVIISCPVDTASAICILICHFKVFIPGPFSFMNHIFLTICIIKSLGTICVNDCNTIFVKSCNNIGMTIFMAIWCCSNMRTYTSGDNGRFCIFDIFFLCRIISSLNIIINIQH